MDKHSGRSHAKIYICFLLVLIILSLYQCKTAGVILKQPDGKSLSVNLNTSPVISPAESIKMMQVQDGFEVKLVASEPLISAPVALAFDNNNRIWVVEMNGYMPDSTGAGEQDPTGKVVILEDKNNDGQFDQRKVFLDSLVMPRAICLIESGILVAEPPNLWYYEIVNDKPGKRILVDNQYTQKGNVEHYPNGLLRAMDNWIYNAKSDKRYRKSGNNWLIEKTHFRGQWGISQDNYGRLYYNENPTNLLGDYFTPGLGSSNKNQRGISGFDEKIVADNRVYPVRPTPGVNRGYMENILDDSLRLINFTAACGPVIYRGDLFGPEYNFNAFVAEPSANLIKRNILSENRGITSGEQAYKSKEFLASVDERFRPVNLYNGPDGALYVVDMYRGIIQHKTYLTPYLKKQIALRELSAPLNCGRIYKIVPKKKKAKSVKFPETADKLVSLLGHSNGWVRDKTQQLLIDRKDKRAVPVLREVLKETSNPLKVIHAMWTLQGLGELPNKDVLYLLNQPVWPIRMQALSILPLVINNAAYKQYGSALNEMIARNDDLAAPYIGFLIPFIKSFDQVEADVLLHKLIKKYPNDKYVSDAVISNLEGREELYLNEITKAIPDTNLVIHKQLQKVIISIKNASKNQDPSLLIKEFPKGSAIYSSSCQACHGADGNGVKGLAPPLNKSEWVTGNKEKLLSIVLFGLTGPVRVNGHLYKVPEINGDMPGIGFSKEFSDEDVAQLLSFIRKSWQNNGDKVNAGEVIKVRQKFKNREKAFTVEELDKL